ncbi:MAG: Reversal of tor2 lethality [Chaenotheca gracillima]|nr:MAG: Reversal of tor2 lethality [Chaenotheca gracillima]
MPPRRLVRRQPLAERIKAYLNPLDFLLWLSEEVDSNDWDELQRSYGIPLGIAINIVFLVARANSAGHTEGYDDVFGEDRGRGSGWMSWFASFIVHLLSLVSILNALYTFLRKRHYRLFETSVDEVPSTPSAHRVRVDSSPVSSSPLRFLSSILTSSQSAAEARSHPSATRDVWEVAVWDPLPACLKLFCLFSPGHVLVYWLFIPVPHSNPRPSTAIFTTLLLGALLSIQLLTLQASFGQQIKDTALIHKEVLHEYDTKFVRPHMNPPVRDVSTQYDAGARSTTTSKGGKGQTRDSSTNVVETYTPTTIIKKGFQTNPNPNYAAHYDPDGITPLPDKRPPSSRSIATGGTPAYQTPLYASRDASSPVRRPNTALRQPQFRGSTGGSGDGGSLGVYSHASSPLKKATSLNLLNERGGAGGHRPSSPTKRDTSPLKKAVVPGGAAGVSSGVNRYYKEPGRRESGYF